MRLIQRAKRLDKFRFSSCLKRKKAQRLSSEREEVSTYKLARCKIGNVWRSADRDDDGSKLEEEELVFDDRWRHADVAS